MERRKVSIPPSRTHVMVDLETLGTAASAKILSIGLVAFDGRCTFASDYMLVNPDTQEGRTEDAATKDWWCQQNKEAFAEVQSAYQRGLPHAEAVIRLTEVLEDWQKAFKSDLYMWGNGSDFDITILTSFMHNKTPWKFWNVQSLRTLRLICPTIRRPVPDIEHHALHDAKAEARWAIDMHSSLTCNHLVAPFL